MIVRQVVKAKAIGLTNAKRWALSEEYDRFQHFLKTGEDLGVYSSNKQQGLRFYKIIKTNNHNEP